MITTSVITIYVCTSYLFLLFLGFVIYNGLKGRLKNMKLGLIGEKLSHSYSKVIHEKILDCTYFIKPIPRDELDAFMKAKDFDGINVTIPYKQAVIPYLDSIDEAAEKIGAVNTIVNDNGKLTGYNTDFAGFLYMIEKNNVEIEGKKVLVLGRGGASKAIIAVLSSLRAKHIYIVYHKPAEGCISYEEAYNEHSDADVIINTTPVGMYPNTDASPIDLKPFTKCTAVLDIIYNPAETVLTKQAKELGMTAATGLDMLVAQAVYAEEHFQHKVFFHNSKEYINLIDSIAADIDI